MHALAVKSIPVGDEWSYEMKFHGYRCLAGRDKSGVMQLVAQIEFAERTPDGHWRHSKFMAPQDDKHPHEVVREAES
jgi:ATP-dependent DNA ligase